LGNNWLGWYSFAQEGVSIGIYKHKNMWFISAYTRRNHAKSKHGYASLKIAKSYIDVYAEEALRYPREEKKENE